MNSSKGEDMMRGVLGISILALVFLLSFVGCNSSSDNSDDTPPPGSSDPVELAAVNPAVNDNSAVSASPISATFDKEMDAASPSTFVVYGSQTGKLSGLYTGDGSITLIFSPDEAFKIGEEIEVIETISDQLGARGLAAGDWNGNGDFDLDLAVANFTASTVVILENDSNGRFLSEDTVGGQIGASALASGDWNEDGDLDLAVANSGGDNVTTLKNIP
jgi:hypothetical protein